MKKPDYIPVQNAFSESLREAIEDSSLTQEQWSAATGIPDADLSGLKSGKLRLTPENDLRLSRFLSLSPGFLLRLQMAYEMRLAEREKGAQIEKEVTPAPAPAHA